MTTTRRFIAALPMYDAGDLVAANDALWSAVRERVEARGLADLPAALTRNVDTAEVWSAEGLLLSQICGYPFACRRPSLVLLAAPVYAIDGCTPTEHRSFVVVRAGSRFSHLGDLARRTAAVNELDSVTGRHLLGDAVADVGGSAGFFAHVAVTGSHAASLTAVARGEADVAAIDCITHHHLARQRPELVRETRVLHVTRSAPVPPFVIAGDCGEIAAALVSAALREAVSDPRLEDARRLLGLAALTTLPAAAYDTSLALARRAARVFAPEGVQAPAQPLHTASGETARTARE